MGVLSFTSVIVMVTDAVDVSAGTPESVAITSKVYNCVVSKSSAPEMEINPDEGSTLNGTVSEIENDTGPKSASVADTDSPVEPVAA